MGTKYVRGTAAPTDFTITEGETSFFDIEKIYSEIEIGNVLNIDLRQDPGASHSFVSFS